MGGFRKPENDQTTFGVVVSFFHASTLLLKVFCFKQIFIAIFWLWTEALIFFNSSGLKLSLGMTRNTHLSLAPTEVNSEKHIKWMPPPEYFKKVSEN